mmetsp:Transcript_3707/g.6503  ORF Transcript_3707/g.6503 Transcript_3707/m.6503 type:complete len:602 (+) Transcript_3707:70-1875(+)|eukprot:CAMPEP_0196658250 /NCGR_PEP_ID=MMETSP1086-20130531/28347_1 /TAXON_ID=77921 /ORGANISM="Cyanoptyche  gloeocystis , Strain SAG4.97" /LENGTH=601 /DNA_ID=CAMNT_0041991725 /DNA_START=68 /DNA_END=1873 /DNA_ORIENTATION=+
MSAFIPAGLASFRLAPTKNPLSTTGTGVSILDKRPTNYFGKKVQQISGKSCSASRSFVVQMSNEVIFDEDSREALRRGVDAVADAVRITMGPKGRNVVLGSRTGPPRIVNDGVTIAKEVELEEPTENAGVKLVQEVASRANDEAGDGTTTATVLAKEIVSEGLKQVAAGANPVALRRGIEKTCAMLIEEIMKVAVPVTENDYEKVAAISSNDEQIGKLIGDAMRRVGRNGILQVETSKSVDTSVEIEEGMEIDRGYLSAQFITNPAKSMAELLNARILLTDKRISAVGELLPVLEKVTQTGQPLLVIAEDVTGEALSTLVLNKNAGVLRVCAIKCPSFGQRRVQYLEDLAVLTGGQVISEDFGLTLDKVELEMLGMAQKITVYQNKTIILAGDNHKDQIDLRVKQLQKALAVSQSDYEREKLQERISKLTGGIAVIRVGAPTETEMESNKLRYEDACNATKAAVEEGIVPGGGVCLLKLAAKVEEFKQRLTEPDEQLGAEIVMESLYAPARQIADNAGADGQVIVELLKDQPFKIGYNAVTGAIEDIVESGILDPAKVTRSALEAACSVAAMILTTKALVAQLPASEDELAAQEDVGQLTL